MLERVEEPTSQLPCHEGGRRASIPQMHRRCSRQRRVGRPQQLQPVLRTFRALRRRAARRWQSPGPGPATLRTPRCRPERSCGKYRSPVRTRQRPRVHAADDVSGRRARCSIGFVRFCSPTALKEEHHVRPIHVVALVTPPIFAPRPGAGASASRRTAPSSSSTRERGHADEQCAPARVVPWWRSRWRAPHRRRHGRPMISVSAPSHSR